MSDSFENNLKNLKATLAVEDMEISDDGVETLKRIENGQVSYIDVIEELKKKYMQRI